YNATTNKFLPGNRVVLTERATQCLTSFSLDFERTSANTSAGPDMTVSSVSVNGVPARFSFVQPTYPARPGVTKDGDGTTEGWFRASDGGFVTPEPVASEDWMPLNDYPTAKPSYDFSDTVTAGRTVVANGELVSVRHHP